MWTDRQEEVTVAFRYVANAPERLQLYRHTKTHGGLNSYLYVLWNEGPNYL
jgi:hypothetical protein